jgi:hypothetical protein
LAFRWDGRRTRFFFKPAPAPIPMGLSSRFCARSAGTSDASA